MLTIGLEPITLEMEQILSLSCLPFSPSEQTLRGSKALLRENVGRAGDQNLLLLCPAYSGPRPPLSSLDARPGSARRSLLWLG